jgi:hypothetical protein
MDFEDWHGSCIGEHALLNHGLRQRLAQPVPVFSPIASRRVRALSGYPGDRFPKAKGRFRLQRFQAHPFASHDLGDGLCKLFDCHGPFRSFIALSDCVLACGTGCKYL